MSEEERTIVIDFSQFADQMEKRDEKLMQRMAELFKKPAESKSKYGRGYTEGYGDKMDKVLESLQSVSKGGKNWTMAEEWTIVIPAYHQAELRASLRDHVWTTTVLQGEQGDVARIPYVRDFDFETLAAVGNAFAASTTGIIAGLTTTLYEAGAWTDVAYNLIERFDSNLLEELNAVFARAAVRAEDMNLMTQLNAGTGTNFANVGEGGAAFTGTVGRFTGPANFYAANVPTALGRLLRMGKAVRPGECVLYMTARAYAALLAELTASQVIAVAQPDIITQGEVERYLGVAIVVGGYAPWNQRTNAATGTVELCFLMRGRRALVLAPKRDILIETDKQIATRQLRVTGSHTFGIEVIERKEAVMIWTSATHPL